jgi:DNA-binding NarL/FixJ family response regulator
MSTITVLLAEDHRLVREGLRALLNLGPDIEIVGEAGNGREAVTMAGNLRPDGHCHADLKRIRSNPANSPGCSQYQGAHTVRTRR